MKVSQILYAAIILVTSSFYTLASTAEATDEDTQSFPTRVVTTIKAIPGSILAIPGAVYDTANFYNPRRASREKDPETKQLMFWGFAHIVHLLVEDPATLLALEPVPFMTEGVRHATQARFLHLLSQEKRRLHSIGGHDEEIATINKLMIATTIHWMGDLTLYIMRYITPRGYEAPVLFDEDAKGYKRIGLVAIIMTLWSFPLLYNLTKLYSDQSHKTE